MAGKTITVDTYCPGCKKEHPTAIPIEELELSIGKIHKEKEEPSPNIAEIVSKEIEKRLPKEPEKPKEVIKEVLKPYDYEPNAFCTDGRCTKNHHKDTYKQRVTKKCTNCGQFAPKAAAKCAWCGSKGIDDATDRFEDLDDDELDDLGVPRPVHDHEHEHGGA